MLYVWRVCLHTSGYSSIAYFQNQKQDIQYNLLMNGIIIYWLLALILLGVTKSFKFIFFIYIQPFLCMTFFLAVINIGFHGFLEFDENFS